VAVLKGSWKPNQMATATVHTVNQQTPHTGSDTYEELRLERVDYLGAYRIPLETGLSSNLVASTFRFGRTDRSNLQRQEAIYGVRR
jgi:hypothetical protein